MIRRNLLALVMLATLGFLPVGAIAQQINRKQPIAIETNRGYFLYRTTIPADLQFIRQPDASDILAYRQRRAEALRDAREAWERQMVRYRAALATYERENAAIGGRRRPVQPIEPVDATLAFASIEEQNAVSVYGGAPVVKIDAPREYYYLMSVPPGTYVVYGSVYMDTDGWTGVCMCMGTVKFEVAAGQVLDLGSFSITLPGGLFRSRVSAETLASLAGSGMTSLKLEPNPPGWAYPERLASLPIQPAVLHAAGKIPNFRGVQIDRLTPIQGVLAYRRDSVIDVRTGEELP